MKLRVFLGILQISAFCPICKNISSNRQVTDEVVDFQKKILLQRRQNRWNRARDIITRFGSLELFSRWTTGNF